MFSLIWGFLEYLFKVPSIHILIIGLDHAGKSSLLEKIKFQYGPKSSHTIPIDRIPPTIGMNIAKIKHRGAQIIFWDLGGQSKMRSIWESYYTSANAVVFVVDSSDRYRLQEAKIELDGVCRHDILKRIPMTILANKQDLPDALSPLEIISILGLTTDITKIFSVSALSGVGIDTSMNHIINDAKIHANESSS